MSFADSLYRWFAMNFLTPLAFALAVLLPLVVALYFLRLRRQEQVVSSVYLWQEMVRDTAANAPWQRLRANWLLLLQLLFLAVLILALARPFSWTMAARGGHLILVVDTSGSMAATDVRPDRLSSAAELARGLAENLPPEMPVTLIAAGGEAQVVLSGSRSREQLSRALDGLRAGPGGADLATALELAAAVASGEPEAQIVVLSDGGVEPPERFSSAAQVRYVRVGESGENQAISALSLTPGAGGRGLDGFVRVVNYGRQEVARRLILYSLSAQGGEAPITARDLTLPPGGSVVLTISDLPPEMAAVEARLEGQDNLPLDDRAWAVAPVLAGAQVQIVGPGNRFLETALALLPGVEVTAISLEEYEAVWPGDTASPGVRSPNWLTVFDAVVPQEGHYPPGALLFVGPVRSTEFFSITSTLPLPVARPASASEPLLRYVDLRGITIQEAGRLRLPVWGRPVVVASGGAPLLVAGETEGRRLAVLAFDLRRSDLPLQVTFPLLLANLVGYLAPGTAGGVPETVAPSRPLVIPAPPQAERVCVTRPDGTSAWLPVAGGEALFDDTGAPGIYEVAGEGEGQRWLLGRFAVNGLSPSESDIAPRQRLELAGGGERAVAAERPVRREWWSVLAWAALALLVAEWLVQYRGVVAWAWGRTLAAMRRSG